MSAREFAQFRAEVESLLERKLTPSEVARARNLFSYRLPPESLVTLIRCGRQR